MSRTVEAYDRFDHAASGERDRLRALAEMHDPATQSLLSAWVKPGWRCLDVGAGAGAVSVQLQTMVGPTGRVVASDMETTFLKPLETRGIEVVHHDITAGPVAGPDFDLVFSRFVLEWVPDREAALEHMMAAVRPGGLLVVETGDWGARIHAAYPPELDAVFAAAVELIGAGGCETDCGRRLHGRLVAIGLEGVSGRAVSILGCGGDTAPARWVLRSTDLLAPVLVERGLLTESEIDATRRAVADPGSRFWVPPLVSGWGWKPAV